MSFKEWRRWKPASWRSTAVSGCSTLGTDADRCCFFFMVSCSSLRGLKKDVIVAKERRFLTVRVGVAGPNEMGRLTRESGGRGGRGGRALNGDRESGCEGGRTIDDGVGDGTGAHERGCSAGSADSFKRGDPNGEISGEVKGVECSSRSNPLGSVGLAVSPELVDDTDPRCSGSGCSSSCGRPRVVRRRPESLISRPREPRSSSWALVMMSSRVYGDKGDVGDMGNCEECL